MNTRLAILPCAVFAASGVACAATAAPVPVTEVRLPAKAEAPAPVKVAAAAAPDAKPADAKSTEDKPQAQPAEPPRPEAKKTSLMDVAAGPAAPAATHGRAKPAAAPRSAPRAAAEQIIARRGDTLDRLVATRFNHLPFRPDVLRDALARVNAGAMQPGSRTRLAAGAKITLPADAEVRRLVLGGEHDDGQAHEPTNPVLTSQGWIRFP